MIKLKTQKTETSQVSVERHTFCDLAKNQKPPSLLAWFVSSKLGLAMLHRYFLLTRGMTFGVRVLVVTEDNEILLVKHSYISGWYLPGGGVDYGEDLEIAAVREVYEETGISDLSGLTLIGINRNTQVSKRDYVAYFHAKTSSKNVSLNLEISDIRFVEKTEFIRYISECEMGIIPKEMIIKFQAILGCLELDE